MDKELREMPVKKSESISGYGARLWGFRAEGTNETPFECEACRETKQAESACVAFAILTSRPTLVCGECWQKLLGYFELWVAKGTSSERSPVSGASETTTGADEEE